MGILADLWYPVKPTRRLSASSDGGGAGRDANDDKRVELTEWLNGYRGVAEHGFVGLTGIANTGQARSAFAKMDDNGGGIVLLDEWCFYLKGAEIEAGTEIGRLLNMDEEGGVGKKEKLSATRKPLPGRVSAAEVQAKRERRAFREAEKKAAAAAATGENGHGNAEVSQVREHPPHTHPALDLTMVRGGALGAHVPR